MRTFIVLSLLFFGQQTFLFADSTPAGVLGEGTSWSTPWYIVESGVPGPTVLVAGGVHGNEPAGAVAADQIRHWKIEAGKLVVVPRVNRLGLIAEMRWFPEERNNRQFRDLNRNFPTQEELKPRTQLAEELWDLVQAINPDFVVDLHEGFDFHKQNSKSVGSSIIFKASEERTTLAKKMLESVNEAISDSGRKLVLLSRSGAVKGSLVRACQDRLQIHGFICETTFKDQPLSLRTRQHRVMVSTLFQNIGLLSSDQSDQLTPSASDGQIRIGMYDAAGATSNGIKNFNQLFSKNDRYQLTQIGPADMKSEVLKQFDVLLFPGGSGSKQGKAIGAKGRDAIRAFGKDGGGVVGVCAGAYLCSSHYSWSLDMINSAVFNKTVDIPGVGKKSMWYRGGPSQVKIEFGGPGKDVFQRDDTTVVRYQNGPIVSKGDHRDLPDYEVLAWFRSEVSRYQPQEGTMVNTPAIITAPYGKGRVLCISPHPEATPGLESEIFDAIEFVNPQN